MAEKKEADNVAIGIVSDETVPVDFLACLLSLMNQRIYDIRNRVIQARGYVGRLDIGRSTVAKVFLEQTDADYLLMLDTDMVFGVKEYDMLKQSLKNTDKPSVLSGLYFQIDGQPCVFEETEDGTLANVIPQTLAKHRFYRAASVGLGFTMAPRTVFEKIAEQAYDDSPLPYFDNTARGHADQPLADDSSFCVRANDAGCPVYVDTKVQIGHLKTVTMFPRLPDKPQLEVPEKKLIVP